MIRGTTPTLTFTTPYAAELVQSGYISFAQRETDILDVPLSDQSVTISDNAIAITLTQEQTLAFDASLNPPIATAQIRALLTSGKAVASNIVQIPICKIIKEGEI